MTNSNPLSLSLSLPLPRFTHSTKGWSTSQLNTKGHLMWTNNNSRTTVVSGCDSVGFFFLSSHLLPLSLFGQKSNCQYSHFLSLSLSLALSLALFYPFLPQWLHWNNHNGSVMVTKASEMSRSYLYVYSSTQWMASWLQWSVLLSKGLMPISLSFSCVLVCTSRNIQHLSTTSTIEAEQQQATATTSNNQQPCGLPYPKVRCVLWFASFLPTFTLSLPLPLSLSFSLSLSVRYSRLESSAIILFVGRDG